MDSPKKRGRPKKVESPKAVVNEEAKMITMTQDKSEEDVSLKVIQQRWATIFGKYASTGFDNLAGAWAMSWSQLNNPFLQNQRIKQINAKAQKVQSEDLQNALNNPENSEMTF